MNIIDWDLRNARTAAAKEGHADGRAAGLAEGCDQAALLVAAMEHDGRAPGEILAALTSDDRDAPYERYGIAS